MTEVVAALIWDKDKFLICQRPANKARALLWEFVGGKVEQGETVRLKKYFYVLRPLLACKWILAEGTPPPMLFKTLMDKYLDEDIKPDVLKLLDLKMNMPEITEGKRFDRVNDYIDKNIAQMEDVIKNFPDRHGQNWEVLNKIFIDLLY